MLINAYTIFDVKAEIHHKPFFFIADGEAARAFSDLANDATTSVGRHPADYTLYRIGTFDDASGLLMADQRVHIAHATSLLVRPNPLPLDPVEPSTESQASQDAHNGHYRNRP